MRTTTKIVLSVILSIFLISFFIIIGAKFIDRDKYKQRHNYNVNSISQDNMIEIDVKPFQTILIDREESKYDTDLYLAGTVRISPQQQDMNNKLRLPEELLKFTDITSSNDTMIIRLKQNELYEELYKNNFNDDLIIINDVNYYINTNTVDIVNMEMRGIKIDIRNITTDRIAINGCTDVEIDSCRANLVEPYMRNRSGRFLLKNSQVNELRIDLDKTGSSWIVENCVIEVESLTGSGTHRVNLPKSEAKIMNWIPKNNEAQLIITLKGDTASVMF